MAGSRTVSSPTLSASGAGHSAPMWFLQMDWAELSSRICSYDTQTWNGFDWFGGGFVISGFGRDGKPSAIELVDPQNGYRTLISTEGFRDRLITLWKAYVGALAVSDPVLIFKGFANGYRITRGRVSFGLDWSTNYRQMSPRERIRPAIGVNFTAAPDTVFLWGAVRITIPGR